MAYVIMVPGLAVRSYQQPAAESLRSAGHEVDLLPPIGWRREGTDLHAYARRIAQHARTHGPVDLLVGLSVGSQAATLAAIETTAVRRLLIVSPTMDPSHRSIAAALRGWIGGEHHRDAPKLPTQVRDWVHAGPWRIYRSMQSTIAIRLEEDLPRAATAGRPVTVVHGDADQLSSLPFAIDIADRAGARLLIMPDAPHSWPIGDGDRFVELVTQLVSEVGARDHFLSLKQ